MSSYHCPYCEVTVDQCYTDCSFAEQYWASKCGACAPGPCCCDEGDDEDDN